MLAPDALTPGFSWQIAAALKQDVTCIRKNNDVNYYKCKIYFINLNFETASPEAIKKEVRDDR